jgi:predicted XRE-type DNA-binding protein
MSESRAGSDAAPRPQPTPKPKQRPAPKPAGPEAARAILISAIGGAMTVRGLSQVQAARICRTDQPTLSKVLRGRTDSVTLDKLLEWLLLLGRSVEIRVSETAPQSDGILTALVEESGRG